MKKTGSHYQDLRTILEKIRGKVNFLKKGRGKMRGWRPAGFRGGKGGKGGLFYQLEKREIIDGFEKKT